MESIWGGCLIKLIKRPTQSNMIFYLLCLISFLFAEEIETPDETIVVESHKNLEVYVAPIKMTLLSDEVEAVISKKSVFSLGKIV